MDRWFIFTDAWNCSMVEADSITKAVAAWRRQKRGAAEIVGIIRGSTLRHPNAPQVLEGTAVYGVICCLQGTPHTTDEDNKEAPTCR